MGNPHPAPVSWFPWRVVDPPLTVEELVALAEHAADQEEWARALRFLRLAIAKAPTSARLRFDEAYFLESLGRPNAALEAYRGASELTQDGEPLFHAGRLLLRLGREADAIAAFAMAFERTPELVLDVDGDPDLASVATTPAFRKARRRALARL